jgi:1-aminocyclopropane-1-carboxylate deaminase/D-cysteine desulfhydrase-like pyridoxal-dependent ACC family enzyme
MPHSLIKDVVPEIQLNEPAFSKLSADFFGNNNLEIFMLKLHEIHPVISGNKLFKLIYFLEKAKKSIHRKVITFGGAYSNHLAATAFACKELKIKSVGIIRGEKPKELAPTLSFCFENEMQLEFIDRESYRNINQKDFLEELKNKYGEHILIPEGGFSVQGKEGAGLINQYFTDKDFTHVCLPVGTATTFAGLVDSNEIETKIMGFGVLKNFNDIEKRFAELKVNPEKKYFFFNDYHFGGYAKKTNELIAFMTEFYKEKKIALDFVYTAKMMFGVRDLIQKNYFPDNSKILCIHTGGLQGNNSLAIDFRN